MKQNGLHRSHLHCSSIPLGLCSFAPGTWYGIWDDMLRLAGTDPLRTGTAVHAFLFLLGGSSIEALFRYSLVITGYRRTASKFQANEVL